MALTWGWLAELTGLFQDAHSVLKLKLIRNGTFTEIPRTGCLLSRIRKGSLITRDDCRGVEMMKEICTGDNLKL